MPEPELATPLTLKDEARWFAESFGLEAPEQERIARAIESAFNDGLKSGYRQGYEKASA